MPTLLRMPEELYEADLKHVVCPHHAYYTLRDALQGYPSPQPAFMSHLLEFLARNYNAPEHLMEDAFQELQKDLAQARVLIIEDWVMIRAYHWQPPNGEHEGRWTVPGWVFAEHRTMLQLALDNVKRDVTSASLSGAVESPSALGRAFETAKGAAKQVANDLLRRNAALNAQWQAENGMATFTDKATGEVLSADELKQRWENEGKDALPIDGADQQTGAQMAKDSPALGAIVPIVQTAASRGRNIIQNPEDLGKDITKAIQGLRGPNDKQLSEALGKIGGEQAKHRQGMETDPRYVDRYHGPDDMARDKDGKLVELEYKGNKNDSTSVARDNQNNRQGSVDKNKRRSEKMTGDKSQKIGQPSNRQGGVYTEEEIDLWKEVKDKKGEKRHVSVHTNTETGVVKTYERDDDGDIQALLDEFKIENFDAMKSTIKDFLK